MKRCPKCGNVGTGDDVFCEADGARLAGDPASGPSGLATAASSASTCTACGLANADSGDGYCSACGLRLTPAVPPPETRSSGVRPYVPGDVAGPIAHSPALAELTDRGRRHPHNEDATAVASGRLHGEPWAVLVVCDGVSTSTHADQASRVAASTTRDALAHFFRVGDAAFEPSPSAMSIAIRAAHVAVCASPAPGSPPAQTGDPAPPPGTTLVAAIVFRRRIVVGWVGDSRAYWIAKGGAELLTRDHSWVNETVDRGEMTELEAMRAPLAHALTRCLGPLEVGEQAVIEEIEPEVKVRDLPGPGSLVLCSDGLWNYAPGAPEIAALVRAAGEGAPAAAIAGVLVHHALAAGGGDNVSVAVYNHT